MDKFAFLPEIVKKGKTSIKRGPFGSALKKSFFVEKGYKVYEQKNAIKDDFSLGHYYVNKDKFEELKGFEVKSGDIIISCSGTIGKIAVAPQNIEQGIINQALLKISLNNDIITTPYFKFWFENYVLQGELESIGAAIKNIVSVKELKQIPIPLPPLPEQQRIVTKLDGLFAKIDQAISLLEENILHTQALMGSVLDEDFGNSNKKSKPIKDLVLKTKTLSPKAEYSNNEFTYIDITSVDRTIFQIKSPKILKGNDAPSRARKVVEKGDIVFATTRPNLKNIAIVSAEYNNPIASTGFCLLRTNNELLNNEYLFYFLISEKVQEYIQPFIKGAQYPAISDKDLLSIEIPVLSIKEQSEIVCRIKTIFDVSNNLVKTQTEKLTHLKALKSSLLDQAFKGEL
ncbi:hypothetical protein FG167_16555 [Lacinutrix sp. WUR7]|uniref:restriction endonuclease subunit S n=1 Tax=Lacinutrix sp. WUR7 TaxID=2653681 RepID=UPI00193CB2D7|nr:restriction endonuclease subunit S [Lacinutrix sp. WUR7]QRM90782.1 hypothetical protein FG167_16555 [Lacinutrix sp. WUR7]